MRVCAARGWNAAYHGYRIDLTYPSHTLDLPQEPPQGLVPPHHPIIKKGYVGIVLLGW